MSLETWLHGRPRWLVNPSTLGNGAVAAFAAQYATFTVVLSAQARAVFVPLVVVCAAAVIVLAEVIAARSLRTLRGLSTGRATITGFGVLAALSEVRRFPDRIARLSAISWVVAVGLVAGGLKVASDASWEMCGRVMLIGLYFAPLSVVLVTLLVNRRANELVERLAEAVTVREALSVASPPRLDVRRRLVLLTVLMVGIPAAMLVDVGRALSHAAVQAVLAAPLTERVAVAAAEEQALVLKLVWLCLFALVLAGAVAWGGATLVVGPLQRVAEDATRIASGELGRATFIAAEGETWAVASVFAGMKERLVELVGQLHGAGRQVSSFARTLHDTTTRYEGGASEQAAALNETSATTEELAHSARQIAANATSVLEIAQQTLDAAESGQAIANAFQAAVERMRHDNRSIAAAVERLAKRVQQIGRIVEVINNVADRSDLLALSAELEGTRAGEVGRGFSLVSTEMRRLAENVLESTAEVEELIGEIREATGTTAAATARGSTLTESSTALAEDVTKALSSVAELARQTSDSVRTISLATQQQQTGTDRLAEAMADILGVTQQSLAATRQLAGANERLQGLSTALGTVVDRFRIVA